MVAVPTIDELSLLTDEALRQRLVTYEDKDLPFVTGDGSDGDDGSVIETNYGYVMYFLDIFATESVPFIEALGVEAPMDFASLEDGEGHIVAFDTETLYNFLAVFEEGDGEKALTLYYEPTATSPTALSSEDESDDDAPRRVDGEEAGSGAGEAGSGAGSSRRRSATPPPPPASLDSQLRSAKGKAGHQLRLVHGHQKEVDDANSVLMKTVEEAATVSPQPLHPQHQTQHQPRHQH
jgi:hypothetical protein